MEGETEAGVAAAEGEFSITGAPNLSRLAVDGEWCSQQEEAAVIGGVGSWLGRILAEDSGSSEIMANCVSASVIYMLAGTHAVA